ncbi:hypothetical protein C8F04DRAFT_1320914 [Mycena alexandri]|uniref:Uncharacterized protein n=1 Tax=Mycena alexandri TaxID=1745969 RepID=A0AAD6S284_9AGAR|nr:hypothetical protein C8F04DRAFT_1320914 [Mycena alexandri]
MCAKNYKPSRPKLSSKRSHNEKIFSQNLKRHTAELTLSAELVLGPEEFGWNKRRSLQLRTASSRHQFMSLRRRFGPLDHPWVSRAQTRSQRQTASGAVFDLVTTYARESNTRVTRTLWICGKFRLGACSNSAALRRNAQAAAASPSKCRMGETAAKSCGMSAENQPARSPNPVEEPKCRKPVVRSRSRLTPRSPRVSRVENQERVKLNVVPRSSTCSTKVASDASVSRGQLAFTFMERKVPRPKRVEYREEIPEEGVSRGVVPVPRPEAETQADVRELNVLLRNRTARSLVEARILGNRPFGSIARLPHLESSQFSSREFLPLFAGSWTFNPDNHSNAERVHLQIQTESRISGPPDARRRIKPGLAISTSGRYSDFEMPIFCIIPVKQLRPHFSRLSPGHTHTDAIGGGRQSMNAPDAILCPQLVLVALNSKTTTQKNGKLRLWAVLASQRYREHAQARDVAERSRGTNPFEDRTRGVGAGEERQGGEELVSLGAGVGEEQCQADKYPGGRARGNGDDSANLHTAARFQAPRCPPLRNPKYTRTLNDEVRGLKSEEKAAAAKTIVETTLGAADDAPKGSVCNACAVPQSETPSVKLHATKAEAYAPTETRAQEGELDVVPRHADIVTAYAVDESAQREIILSDPAVDILPRAKGTCGGGLDERGAPQSWVGSSRILQEEKELRSRGQNDERTHVDDGVGARRRYSGERTAGPSSATRSSLRVSIRTRIPSALLRVLRATSSGTHLIAKTHSPRLMITQVTCSVVVTSPAQQSGARHGLHVRVHAGSGTQGQRGRKGQQEPFTRQESRTERKEVVPKESI